MTYRHVCMHRVKESKAKHPCVKFVTCFWPVLHIVMHKLDYVITFIYHHIIMFGLNMNKLFVKHLIIYHTVDPA